MARLRDHHVDMGSNLNFPQLEVGRSEQDGVQVVTLSGELDLASVGEMEAALSAATAAERPQVCLDLSDLQFIDSTGLATLIRTHLSVTEAAGALAVVCTPGAVLRTVQTTGLLEMLTVKGTRAEALKALERPQ
jgi:anti-sigma B factor antagonist